MLKLKNIKKNYFVADMTVEALKGINLNFRKNEFVSILGPSGCGKTTMLNIIGGLDKYTSGDLFINGRSTKEYKDRDWDVYRNHRIGFIFQSYNLIPHQTVLGNVELALTISGVSKAERIEKAKKALDRVGLQNQYYKKPNQLSGGQCQRVAIARALVNEPEILLADEPTGALDTVTSVQIMDLIKEIAQERLVIMVTHNPELAEQYSTRIVKLLDGNVLEDSNPFSEDDEALEVQEINKAIEEEEKALLATNEGAKKAKKKEKAKMSFWTAFKLSARNLWSKTGRTIMTCFAGSIGIIGVSAVLAVSSGVKGYIADMQDDMLSGNPITITETGYDLSSMMDAANTMADNDPLGIIEGAVNVNSMIKYLAKTQNAMNSLFKTNDLNDNYINFVKDMPEEYYSAMSFGYGIDVSNNIYTDFYANKEIENGEYKYHKNLSIAALISTYTGVLQKTDYSSFVTYVSQLNSGFSQLPASEEYVLGQYDVLAGHYPQNKNEVILVVDQNQALTDLLLAQFGYYTQEEFLDIAYSTNDSSISYKERFTYDELLDKKFTYYDNDTVFTKYSDDVTNNPDDFTFDFNTMTMKSKAKVYDCEYKYNPYSDNFEGGEELKVVGILKLKENRSYGCLMSGAYYTEDFTKHMLDVNKDSEFNKYVNDLAGEAVKSSIDYKIVNGAPDMTSIKISGLVYSTDFWYKNSETGEVEFYSDKNMMNPDPIIKSRMGSMSLVGTLDQTAVIMGIIQSAGGGEATSSSIAKNLTIRNIAGNDLPNSISIYPLDFDQKYMVTDYLDAWNDDSVTINNESGNAVENRTEVVYTDTVGLIIGMVNTLIDIITYALVAFTALSLVVSCVMIAIITYVSVMERIKEIGVIRSLGGRKKDVSHLFNAETFIIGGASGIVGIAVTYLLSFILNLIVRGVSDGMVKTIAKLTPLTAIIMIIISILLTCISGLIPARSAAKKDPVVALRTE